MKRIRYSEVKIISILKEHEAGAAAKAMSRHFDEATLGLVRSGFN